MSLHFLLGVILVIDLIEGHKTEFEGFISKAYFEKHETLNDSHFENFIRDEISLASCKERQNALPRLISLQRSLIGEGSHRRLSSIIELEFEVSEGCCGIIVVERLPLGVFADPFELQHLVQRSVFSDVAVFGDTNLELPSFRSNRSLVEIHVELDPDSLSGKSKQLEIKILLPLHARYPPLGHGFATVKFGTPDIFLSNHKEGSISTQGCLFVPADNDIKLESIPVAWEVPCGSKEHTNTVSIVTFISAVVSALLIVLTSVRHSNFIIRNETKKL